MKKNNQKSILLLIAVATLLVVAVGGTLAYLVDSTNPVTNTFTPTTVDITVTDEVVAGAKKNVVIHNDSDIPVYVRVAVIANWYNDKGEIVAEWSEYSKLPISSNWSLSGDFYYYNGTVAANSTVNFFTEGASYTPGTPPVAGAHLRMDVIAQAVQAEPTTAVSNAWGFVPGSSN